MTRKELYQALVEKFGIPHQVMVATEECCELAKELTKAGRGKPNDMRLAEEIADLRICIEQMQILYGISEEQIELFAKFKLERLEAFFIKGGHK